MHPTSVQCPTPDGVDQVHSELMDSPLVSRHQLTSSSLYQDRFSAVSTNQYSFDPPFMIPMLLMVSQPFRMTCRGWRGQCAGGQANPQKRGEAGRGTPKLSVLAGPLQRVRARSAWGRCIKEDGRGTLVRHPGTVGATEAPNAGGLGRGGLSSPSLERFKLSSGGLSGKTTDVFS